MARPQQVGGLRGDVLSSSDMVVMAVAGSAPAYSLAATTAVLVAAGGLASPAALMWCGIPMVGITWAFNYLGRLDVNAGASYSWVGRALHPALGFLSGWSLIVSATIFMVAGSLPAGAATLSFFSEDAAKNSALATAVGAAWFLLMAGLVIRGIRITARAQWIMTGIEVVILAVFGTALWLHPAPVAAFDWSWLGFERFSDLHTFASTATIAAFFFWGWDVTANLSEETRNSSRMPGLGGLLGVLLVFGLLELIVVGVSRVMAAAEIEANSDNLLTVLADEMWPRWGGKLLILAVLLSTVATLETALLQVTRSLFAMGRDETIPPAFGAAHRRWQTPWVATLAVTGCALVLFVASNLLGSVTTIMDHAVGAIGLQICIYYGLAGLAVVVAYRKLLLKSLGNAIFAGLWPLLGSAFMLWIFVLTIPTLDGITIAIGLGSIAVGVVPMAFYWRRGSAYFRPNHLDAAKAVEVEAAYGYTPATHNSAEPPDTFHTLL
ncbi:APC family permease [Streptomyces sp. 1222.5]|uniref:APC family permease n=1 Tax=Streptomyces sp. 1222.5 TaxID=1881026 RepID=UPI003EBAD084